MKTRLSPSAGVLLALALLSMPHLAAGETGSPITYQGKLVFLGEPVEGPVDLAFRLYDAETGGNQIGTGWGSFVGGGDYNIASGALSFVAGGFTNRALMNNSFIGGGMANKTNAENSVVGGGRANNAAGARQVVRLSI